MKGSTCNRICKLRLRKRRERGWKVHSRDALRGVNSNSLADINLGVRNKINHPNKSIKSGLINVQSIKNKASLIHNYKIDNKVDLTVLTETWLLNNDRD